MASTRARASSPVVDEHPEADQPRMKKRGDVSQWERNVAKRKRYVEEEYVRINVVFLLEEKSL